MGTQVIGNHSLPLNIKSLYNITNQSFSDKAIKDFLKNFIPDDIYSLAQTATCKKLLPETLDEAIDMIMLYTPDIERFFSYRRITSQFLIQYLNKNGIQLRGYATKTKLISDVMKLWAKKYPVEENSCTKLKSDRDNINISVCDNSSDGVTGTEKQEQSSQQSGRNIDRHMITKIKSDEFAVNYVEWFCSLLNSVHNRSSELQCRHILSSLFCANSSLDIFILNPSSDSEIHCTGAQNCATGLFETIQKHMFSLSPNIDCGIQAQQSPHGLIKVFACGTLHNAGNFVGIFEQEFGLVKNPLDKSWQIFYTKMNLKEAVSEVPALPPCPVFEIDSC